MTGPEPGQDVITALDLRGEVCPYTFLKSKLALEGVPAGGVLRVVVDSEASARDVPQSLGRAGHAILSVEQNADGAWTIVISKGSEDP
jgi:tRNA 2-thiouridine synthesizing protein A